MSNSCDCSPRKCIICEFPPCNCKKCKQLRCEGKTDREGKTSLDIEKDCANLDISKRKEGKEGETGSSDADDVIFDIVGVTAFLLMGTAIFWLTVCQNLWRFTIFTIKSGRKIQLLTLVVLLIIIGCITYDGVKGRNRKLQALEPIPPPPLNDTQSTILTTQESITIQHRCPQKCCKCKKCAAKNLRNSCENLLSSSSSYRSNTNVKNSPSFGGDNVNKETPSLCSLCSKQSLNSDISISNSMHTMSDDEIREMYAKFKLYSMPTEMKTPPSPDNLIGFLTNVFNRISGTFRTTPT